MRYHNTHALILFLICIALLGVCCRKDNTEQEEKISATFQDLYPLPQDALVVKANGNRGGRIVSAILDNPETFNQLLFTDETGQTLNQLMSAGLTRLNLRTQEPEPALARSWETSADGQTWTFHLRKGLKWSDGQPFSASDVLFTMEIVNDPEIPSSAQDAILPGIQWARIDDDTITAKLPSFSPAFLRQLDGATVPVLAKHRWEMSYRKGEFPEAMPVSMNPDEFVSLGAFVPKQYRPNELVSLRRNPHYWKTDAAGLRLPYLDEIVFLILPNQDQIYLKIEQGELDTYPLVRPENIDSLKKVAPKLGMAILNVGPSNDADALWFNLNDRKNPETGKRYVDPQKQKWFQNVRFRQAVSHAIHRDTVVKNVLFGKGIPRYGPESQGNPYWNNTQIIEYKYDPSRSLELLQSAGFHIKNDSLGQPVLQDTQENPVRFRLYTNSGNSIRQVQCQFIVDDLSKIGIKVDYTPLDFTSLVSSILDTFDYDAALLGLTNDDLDPAGGMNVWPSNGSLHFWNPEQEAPATAWEKRIDELMLLQLKSADRTERKKYYDEVQMILSEQQPMIYLATQLIHVCAREGIGNLKPVVSRHRTLWNADELFWK